MKNILFDLDGTLTDPYLGIYNCIVYALEKFQIPPPDDLKWCIGPPLQESINKILVDKDEKAVFEAIDLYRERYSKTGMYENEVYGGIVDMLQVLSEADCTLFVATSKPHVYASKILEHFKLGKFFKKIYGAELNGVRRDKAELISYILESENVDEKDAVMIGDRKYDLIGAKKNNVECIAITWGYGSIEELKAEKPNMICNSPAFLTDNLIQ